MHKNMKTKRKKKKIFANVLHKIPKHGANFQSEILDTNQEEKKSEFWNEEEYDELRIELDQLIQAYEKKEKQKNKRMQFLEFHVSRSVGTGI